MGADRLGIRIVGAEGGVEAVAVVGHQALGLDRRRDVLARPGLVLEPHDEGALPGRLVEDAVDHDLGARPPDLVDRRLARPPGGRRRTSAGLPATGGRGQPAGEEEQPS